MIFKVCKICAMLFSMALFTGVIYGQEESTENQSTGTEQEVTQSTTENPAAAVDTPTTAVKPAPQAKPQASESGSGQAPIEELEKQVVIGYGSVKKNDLTGAVASIEKGDMNKSTGFGIESALQGKAAGVTVTSNSGAPGSASMVRIRGFGTVNASEPLYVIDGVSMRGGDISFINPNDIEAISILKDASSAAIYGTRGLNGVILITTKKAEAKTVEDKSVGIQYNGFFGVGSPWKVPNMCNATEWAGLRADAIINSKGDTAGYGTVKAVTGEGTNWWKEITREYAQTQRHDVSFMKASEKVNFYLSGSYSTQDGLIRESDAKKMALHANGESIMSDWLKIGFNTTVANNVAHPIRETDQDMAVIPNMYNVTPASPVRAGSKDTLAPDRFNNRLNPVSLIENIFTEEERTRILADVHANIKITDMFTYISTFGLDLNNLDTNFIQKKFWLSNQAGNNDPDGTVRRTSERNSSWSFENNLTFDKTFGDVHNVKVLVGVSAEDNQMEFLRARSTQMPSNDPSLRYLRSCLSTSPQVDGFKSSHSLLSFLGRLSYDYSSKYFVTLSFRRDGSSRFGPENKWGNFPSAALAWKISEESFMDALTFLQLFKIRAGYGVLGNQDFGDFNYVTTSSPSQNYVLNRQVVPGAAFLSAGNPSLKWEEQSSFNVGLDLSVIEGKIEFSGDYFQKSTKGMLLQTPTPANAGLQNMPWTNGGEIKNTGVDLSLGWSEKVGGFKSRLSGNFSTYKNEVIALSADPGKDDNIRSAEIRGRYLGRTAVGHAVGEFYGYKTNGLFQTDAEVAAQTLQPNAKPGDVKYVDDNNDGQWDQDYIGSPHPLFTYGFGVDLGHEGDYGAVDFRLFLQGSYGNKIYNAVRLFTNTSDVYFNQDKRMLNHWNGAYSTNDASLPRLNSLDQNNTDRLSDIYVEDGSYLRAKDLQIGYTLPKDLFGVHNRLRLYVGSQNLLTFTGYTGLDPEIGQNSTRNDPATGRMDPLDIGVDRGTYPQARTFFGGINISF
jgi:TonB-linked SusC/RagA family outer membrane protein